MTALASRRMEVDLDVGRMSADALAEGWGDGLPLIPPTEDLVAEFVQASGRDPEESLGLLPPSRARCTVEKVAINAVMAGAPAESMGLICSSLLAMIDSPLWLDGINATTAAVVPAIIVNGPIRDRLQIPYQYSALGGAASTAPAIGRAIRLVMRNVAGQVSGRSSESVFGQPGRVIGILAGEWEERSPWAPLAERRGVSGDAVTVFGTVGTCNIVDSEGATGQELLEVIGKSLAYMGNNGFVGGTVFADQMVAINPIWARDIIARDIPSYEDVAEILWQAARRPLDDFPEPCRPGLERRGRVDAQGQAYLVEKPDEIHVFVCGGLGSLHATMFPGFSNSQAVTRAIDAA
jgi:hypothetical protein